MLNDYYRKKWLCERIDYFTCLDAEDFSSGRATSLIPDAQQATPHQTNGQPTQGVMCHML
jgi:hypothetical protein